MNLCEQAETFRLLLLMGVVDTYEVISWADGIIAAEDTVPEWLLDVSLAANQDAWTTEARLREMRGEWDPRAAAYAAMARFAKEFQVNDRFTSQQAARMLAVWAGSAKVNQDDWTEAMVPSWVAQEVAEGLATDQQVVESINACVAHFLAAQAGSAPDERRFWPFPALKPETEWSEFDRDYIAFMRCAYAEGFCPCEAPCISVEARSPSGRSISLVFRGRRNGWEPIMSDAGRPVRLGPIYALPEGACVCVRPPFRAAACLALDWLRGRDSASIPSEYEFVGGRPAGIVLRAPQ